MMDLEMEGGGVGNRLLNEGCSEKKFFASWFEAASLYTRQNRDQVLVLNCTAAALVELGAGNAAHI